MPSTGLEPARREAPPPQDGVSTNFTNWAVLQRTLGFEPLQVPRTGFEPARLWALPPEDSASTNFATWAYQPADRLNRGANIVRLSFKPIGSFPQKQKKYQSRDEDGQYRLP